MKHATLERLRRMGLLLVPVSAACTGAGLDPGNPVASTGLDTETGDASGDSGMLDASGGQDTSVLDGTGESGDSSGGGTCSDGATQPCYAGPTATEGSEPTGLMSDPGPGREVTGGGYTGPLTQEPPPDGLVTNSVRAQSDDDGNAQFEVTGKAGSNVTAVTFAVNGTQVHATLHDGYFAAWWPGSTSLIPRFRPPNPDVTITLGDGSQVTRQIQDYDVSPL